MTIESVPHPLHFSPKYEKSNSGGTASEAGNPMQMITEYLQFEKLSCWAQSPGGAEISALQGVSHSFKLGLPFNMC